MELIIYGTGSGADVYCYFASKTIFDVSAFVCSSDYEEESVFNGLPVIKENDLLNIFYPQKTYAIVSISDYRTNLSIRKEKYLALKEMRFQIATLNFSDNKCGEGSLIEPTATLAPFVEIGNNTHIAPKVGIAHHTKVGSHCHFAINSTVGGCCEIGDNVFLGIGAIISDHVKIGSHCHIAPGMVVMKDLPDNTSLLRDRGEPNIVPTDELVEILKRKDVK